MSSRKQSLVNSMKDMENSIRYMERRVSASSVEKTTDFIILKLCKAVQKLLDIEIEKEDING